MTREIKFRVFQDERMYYDVSTNGARVWWGTSIGSGDEYSLPRAEVKLMQFTGLLDKNGKEIYEGDILKSNFGRVGPVVWYRRGFFIQAESLPNGVTDFLVWEQSEVIGNIYENPELLKI